MTTLPSGLPLAQDPYESQQLTIGVDQHLALTRAHVLDAFYINEKASQFLPKPATNIRPYRRMTKDVQPTGSSSTLVAFGQNIKFNIGNEGLPNLAAVEIHIELPKIVDSGAANLHPADGGYAGAATYINWVPYTGERFLGGGGEPLRWRYGTEVLRTYTCEGIHIKRQLTMDAEGTTKAAAYRNAVGALPDTCAAVRRYQIALWMPHAPDEMNNHQLLPVQAFAQEFQISWKVPTISELVNSDIAATANMVVDPAGSSGPKVFARLHFVVTEKAERGTLANMCLSSEGLGFQTMHIARETPTTVSGAGAQTVTIDLKNSNNPCVFLAFGVRMLDDTAKHGDAGTNDTHVPARTVGGLVKRHNWTNWHPWESYQLFDGGSAITDKRNYTDWVNSTCAGLSNYFPCDLGTYLGVIPFSDWPTVENHGLGHLSIATCTNPKLKIGLPAISTYDSTEAGTSRIVDIFYFERNLVHMKDGNIIRSFNVSE